MDAVKLINMYGPDRMLKEHPRFQSRMTEKEAAQLQKERANEKMKTLVSGPEVDF